MSELQNLPNLWWRESIVWRVEGDHSSHNPLGGLKDGDGWFGGGCAKYMDPSAVSAAMAVSWAWEDACDLAISKISSSTSLAPFEINFSLTLSEFVLKTIQSLIISSGSLKSGSWARIHNAMMNFSAISDESWTGLCNLNLVKTGFALGLTWLTERS